MTQPEKCCGTCKWYPVEQVKHASGRWKRDAVARCQYPKEVMRSLLPTAVTTCYAFCVNPTSTTRHDGTDCPCYEPLEETTDAVRD